MLAIKRKIIISLFKQCLFGLFVYKIAINITVDFIHAGVLLGCGSFPGEEGRFHSYMVRNTDEKPNKTRQTKRDPPAGF